MTVSNGQTGINRPSQVESHLTPVLVTLRVLSVAREQKENLTVHAWRLSREYSPNQGHLCRGRLEIVFPVGDAGHSNPNK